MHATSRRFSTNDRFEASWTSASTRPAVEWRLKHLARTFGGATARHESCDGCTAPLGSEWYSTTFYRGSWADGEERSGSFCAEPCLRAWMERENDVVRR